MFKLFNIRGDDIDKFYTVVDGSVTNVYIRLKRKESYCPKCGRKLISNGVKKK